MFFAVWVSFQPDDTPAERAATAPTQAPAPLSEITAAALMLAYEANELAAQRDYEDQIMLVSGTVESIGDTILGAPFVTLETETIWSVQAMFERDRDEGILADLTQGQPLTVRCRVDGKLGNIILRECSIP